MIRKLSQSLRVSKLLNIKSWSKASRFNFSKHIERVA